MDGEWRQYVDRNAPHNGDRSQLAALAICVNHILKQSTSSLKSINRFEQDLTLIKTIEQILIERGYTIDTLEHALSNKDKLRVQLDLPTILGRYNVDKEQKITSISQVSTIAEIFNSMPAAKKQCSEVHKLIKLYYPIPLTSASCECTFSAMHRP